MQQRPGDRRGDVGHNLAGVEVAPDLPGFPSPGRRRARDGPRLQQEQLTIPPRPLDILGRSKETFGFAGQSEQLLEIRSQRRHPPGSFLNHHPLWLNQALHQGVTQAAHILDDHPVGRPGQRIGCKQDARPIGRHHFLHQHGHFDLFQFRPLPGQVNQRPFGIHRQPTTLDRPQQGVRPAHVEDGLELARERLCRGIFHRRA